MFVKSNTPVIFVGLFLIGMSTAAIRNSKPSPNPGPFGSQMVILYLVLAFIASPIPFRPIPALLLGIAFLFIACGTDVFGFLTTRPARRLGNISYGIYLLQGAVFTGASLFGSLRALDLGSPIGHWTVSLLEAIVLLALATLTHRFVERPAIDLGRRLVSK
jgi:peptidoglycan/LPS O-acetylase OafA/YrhL